MAGGSESIESRQIGRISHGSASRHAAEHEGDEQVVRRIRSHKDYGPEETPETPCRNRAKRKASPPARGFFNIEFVPVEEAPDRKSRQDGGEDQPHPAEENPGWVDLPKHCRRDGGSEQIDEQDGGRLVKYSHLFGPYDWDGRRTD